MAAASAIAVLAMPVGASAAPVEKTLQYACNFPLMVPQPLTLHITSDIPTSVRAGTSLPPFPVDAQAQVSATAAKGLRGLESVTLEGTAVAKATILLPGGGQFAAKVNTTIPKMTIPDGGAFETQATGKTPALTFDEPGDAAFTIGDLVLTMSPRLADDTLTGLSTFETECTLASGQDNTFATVHVVDETTDNPPSQPQGLNGVAGTTTVDLSWDPASDDFGVAGYEVFKDGVRVATVTGTTATVTGLDPNHSYSFTVRAVDGKSQPSPMSAPITIQTAGGGTASYRYTISGTAQLKTLTRGSIPITGAIATTLQLATGEFTGDLSLNPTQARVITLGFLPVTATVQFVTSGPTTGTLTDDRLASSSRVRMKLPSIKAFGAIPLAGGNTCQTKQLSDINLTGTSFDVLSGGTLNGPFTVSDLNGCGLFNGIVSPLTAGSGNLLSLNLSKSNA